MVNSCTYTWGILMNFLNVVVTLVPESIIFCVGSFYSIIYIIVRDLKYLHKPIAIHKFNHGVHAFE